MSDDEVYCIDYSMFLSAERNKDPSILLSTMDKMVAITFRGSHKDATQVALGNIEKF